MRVVVLWQVMSLCPCALHLRWTTPCHTVWGRGDETYSDFLWPSVTSIHSNPLYITAPGATDSGVLLPEMTELYLVE
jgi:hypothetical protein